MAGESLYRVEIELDDRGREASARFERRVARHPSETDEYLVLRLLAAALLQRPGLHLREGVCRGDEPALEVRRGDGRRELWVDVGRPDTRRLVRAARECPEVWLVSRAGRELAQLRLPAGRRRGVVRALGLPPALVAGLADGLERQLRWRLERNGADLRAVCADRRYRGRLTERELE